MHFKQDDSAAGYENPTDFPENGGEIFHVMKGIGDGHGLESVVGKGEGGSVKVAPGTSNANVIETLSSDGDDLFRVFETSGGHGLLSLYNSSGTETFRLTSVSSGRMSVGCNSPEHDLDLHSVAGAACSAAGSRSFIDAGS